MKSIISFLFVFLLNGCEMFPKDERVLASYKIDNSTTVELHYIGLGATTKDVIQVQKKTATSNTLVKIIEGFNDTYKVDVKPLDDTLLKITFTDTINFRCQSRDFIINLNEKVKELK